MRGLTENRTRVLWLRHTSSNLRLPKKCGNLGHRLPSITAHRYRSLEMAPLMLRTPSQLANCRTFSTSTSAATSQAPYCLILCSRVMTARPREARSCSILEDTRNCSLHPAVVSTGGTPTKAAGRHAKGTIPPMGRRRATARGETSLRRGSPGEERTCSGCSVRSTRARP